MSKKRWQLADQALFPENPKCFNYEGWRSLHAKYGGFFAATN